DAAAEKDKASEVDLIRDRIDIDANGAGAYANVGGGVRRAVDNVDFRAAIIGNIDPVGRGIQGDRHRIQPNSHIGQNSVDRAVDDGHGRTAPVGKDINSICDWIR